MGMNLTSHLQMLPISLAQPQFEGVLSPWPTPCSCPPSLSPPQATCPQALLSSNPFPYSSCVHMHACRLLKAFHHPAITTLKSICQMQGVSLKNRSKYAARFVVRLDTAAADVLDRTVDVLPVTGMVLPGREAAIHVMLGTLGLGGLQHSGNAAQVGATQGQAAHQPVLLAISTGLGSCLGVIQVQHYTPGEGCGMRCSQMQWCAPASKWVGSCLCRLPWSRKGGGTHAKRPTADGWRGR